MKRREWDEVSGDYYTEILSPIKNSKRNPLFWDIEKSKGKKKVAGDLGCGIGPLVPLLSRRFGKVIALDYSKEMIEIAEKRHGKLNNVDFIVGDLANLKKFHRKLDVAIAVNVILSDNLAKVNKMFIEIYRTLKKGGKFFGVFPAMEVYLYQAMLIADRSGRGKARRIINKREHDILFGIIDFEGRQKAYYEFELIWRLKKAGFRNIRIDKVIYSWKEFARAGQSYFPSEEEPWDWYVSCGK